MKKATVRKYIGEVEQEPVNSSHELGNAEMRDEST
jgi:hypothetical protein